MGRRVQARVGGRGVSRVRRGGDLGAAWQAGRHQKGSQRKGRGRGLSRDLSSSGSQISNFKYRIIALPFSNPFSKRVSSSPTKIGQVMNDKKGTEEGKGRGWHDAVLTFHFAGQLPCYDSPCDPSSAS